MNITRNDDFISGSAYTHHHGHDGAACPLHREECMISAKGFRSQILGFFDHSLRLVQVIQRGNVDQVNGKGIFTDELLEFRIHPCPLLMSGDMELYRVFFTMIH